MERKRGRNTVEVIERDENCIREDRKSQLNKMLVFFIYFDRMNSM